jgi:hypothetical protein
MKGEPVVDVVWTGCFNRRPLAPLNEGLAAVRAVRESCAEHTVALPGCGLVFSVCIPDGRAPRCARVRCDGCNASWNVEHDDVAKVFLGSLVPPVSAPVVPSRRPSRIPPQATGPGSAIGVASMAAGAAWAIEDPTVRAAMTLVVAVVIYLMGRVRSDLLKASK